MLSMEKWDLGFILSLKETGWGRTWRGEGTIEGEASEGSMGRGFASVGAMVSCGRVRISRLRGGGERDVIEDVSSSMGCCEVLAKLSSSSNSSSKLSCGVAMNGGETELVSWWREHAGVASLGDGFLVDGDDVSPGLVLPDRAAARVCNVLLTNVG